MFNLGQPQQPAGLNLSATGAPMGAMRQPQGFTLGTAQQPQQNAFMGGMMGGMGDSGQGLLKK